MERSKQRAAQALPAPDGGGALAFRGLFGSKLPTVQVIAIGSDNADEMSWQYVLEELNVNDFPAYEFEESQLHGEQGDDVLRGPVIGQGLWTSLYVGGPGDDRIYMAGYKALAYGGLGTDRIRGTPNLDTIFGESPGANPLIGSGDILVGGAGGDIIYGGAGADEICGEGGGDRTYGGTGNDRIDAGAESLDRAYGEGGVDECSPSVDCDAGLSSPVSCAF